MSLLPLLSDNKIPGIITSATPKDKVTLKSTIDNIEIIIGSYDESLPGTSNKMEVNKEGFNNAIKCINNLKESDSEYAFIDEIGYLEKDEEEYLKAIDDLLSVKKCLLVLRKQDLKHINNLLNRKDTMIIDLDEPYANTGCVIMASGVSKRFGDLKLLCTYKNKLLIEHILDKTDNLFNSRVVVTRHKKIKEICDKRNIDCILHELPFKSDTIKLGTSYLKDKCDSIIFIPSDQPELEEDTLISFMILAKNTKDRIIRLKYNDEISSPGLFPDIYFNELENLPEDKGGNVLAKKYGSIYINTDNHLETIDIDTKEDLEKLSNTVMEVENC